jgi:Transcriptional regulator PadR-like family
MSPSGLRRPNDPPLLILVSLADGPKHGHALAKDIEDFAGVRLGPGALYGAITRLDEGRPAWRLRLSVIGGPAAASPAVRLRSGRRVRGR